MGFGSRDRDETRSGRGRRSWAVLPTVAALVVLASVGGAPLQDDPPARKVEPPSPTKTPRKGGLRAPGGPLPTKGLRRAPGNALAQPKAQDAPKKEADNPNALTRYKFKFRFQESEGSPPLAATYYQSKLGMAAPVVLLVHEKGQAGRDFEAPIDELKGQGLAPWLQKQGYAVLVLDLRGHGNSKGPQGAGGGNLRDRAADPKAKDDAGGDWKRMIDDLQAAYSFLVDRNNNGELNLHKFAALGLGEGATLLAAWAASDSGAVPNSGHTSDLAALAWVSPTAEAGDLRLISAARSIAPRIPTLVLSGDEDQAGATLIKEVKPLVERLRQSRVETFPSSLKGARLLRFEPGAPASIARFLDGTIKSKTTEWEPRFYLNPVACNDIETIREVPRAADVAPAPAAEPAKKAAP